MTRSAEVEAAMTWYASAGWEADDTSYRHGSVLASYATSLEAATSLADKDASDARKACQIWQDRAEKAEAALDGITITMKEGPAARIKQLEAALAEARAALDAIRQTDGKAREVVKDLLGFNPQAAERMWFETSQDLMRKVTLLEAEIARKDEALRKGIGFMGAFARQGKGVDGDIARGWLPILEAAISPRVEAKEANP